MHHFAASLCLPNGVVSALTARFVALVAIGCVVVVVGRYSVWQGGVNPYLANTGGSRGSVYGAGMGDWDTMTLYVRHHVKLAVIH